VDEIPPADSGYRLHLFRRTAPTATGVCSTNAERPLSPSEAVVLAASPPSRQASLVFHHHRSRRRAGDGRPRRLLRPPRRPPPRAGSTPSAISSVSAPSSARRPQENANARAPCQKENEPAAAARRYSYSVPSFDDSLPFEVFFLAGETRFIALASSSSFALLFGPFDPLFSSFWS